MSSSIMISGFLVLLMMVNVSYSSSNTVEGFSIAKRYKKWLARHGNYLPSNMSKWDVKDRFQIYKQNVKFIIEFNSQNHSYTMTDNKFADMTADEFKALMGGFGGDRESVHRNFENSSCDVTTAPLSLDWRKKGAVGAVKHQLTCATCWAFSAVAAVEGLTQIKTGKLLSLSEQQLIDCDIGNGGCNGLGNPEKAFEYIERNGGLTTSANYPNVKNANSMCKNNLEIAATINGYEEVGASENCLLNAVAKQPVSVFVASKYFDDNSRFYKSGIFKCHTCNFSEYKVGVHVVTVVGYGNDGEHDYWIVKNSWGDDWGKESGYIRIQRNVDECNGYGTCGIAQIASYPY
ncbi:Cysteine proteinase [Zostera marina]|uniref:Cysteine proteinase n=1 Tax=Zostera marina TaxID=29655 RepID=A0A0K9NZG2_ZOSMR|nr:Cysteine proteinase [Zostera marina]